MRGGALLAIVAGLVLSTIAAPEAVAREPVHAVTTCASLAAADLSAVDARVQSAADSTQNGVLFCEVTGYISPQTHFTMLLPQTTWRGDYLQQGCGGLCGHNDVSLTDPARTSGHQAPYPPLQTGELVVAADDQGHEGDGGLWAKEDPILRVVFGYRSEHDLARTANAIIRAYYGRPPAFSYFDGVSDGGHEALALAQRYPDDFDGILAGAPANNWAPLSLYQAWLVRANMDAQGRQILDASKLPALHAAVMRECADAQGVIRDPRACTFDPASIQCPGATDRPDCLTATQVGAARRLYRGPTTDGVQLFNGGEPYGSEISWQGWMIAPAGDAAWPNDVIAASIALDYFRYMAYWRNPPASFSLRDIRFTLETYRGLAPLGRIYNANNPDLRAFRAHGGKLILYHGWADQAISPWSSLDYYRAAVREMGGFAATQRFSRLYMIPGLYHCPCGPYPTGDPPATVDLMDELVGWVENGNAPSEVTFPVTGSSNTLSVEPFNPLEPAPRNDGLNSNYRYIGVRSAYRPGQELWCETQEQRLDCRAAPRSRATSTNRRR